MDNDDNIGNGVDAEGGDDTDCVGRAGDEDDVVDDDDWLKI